MHKRNRAGGPQFAPRNHTWQDMRRDTWQHFNMGEGSHLHRQNWGSWKREFRFKAHLLYENYIWVDLEKTEKSCIKQTLVLSDLQRNNTLLAYSNNKA